jgi:6-phosphogluconolactonase
MRMKFSQLGRRRQDRSGANAAPRAARLRSRFVLLLIAAASLLAASLLTACETLTVDFVYIACAKAAGANNYGEIDVYEINSESGRMRPIPTSPFPSLGRDPVAEAVSADNQNLFVVNQLDNTIVQFAIGTDGKLYGNNTINTPGIYPLAVAANKSFVFVVDTFQPLPLCSPAEPCSGAIGVYPVNPATSSAPISLGNPVINPAVNGAYWPLTLSGAGASHVIVPTAITVLASGTDVFVSAYDSSVSPSAGYIFGFSVGTGGALTPLSNSPYPAGLDPTAIASDSSSTYVYATDFQSGNVLGYKVSSSLTPLSGSPFAAGNQPDAVVIDPTYSFLYVANSLDSTVTAYSMSSGALTRIGSFATGLQPVAIGIDPSTNHFLYTLNFLDNTVSDFELSATAGTLLNAQDSPYAVSPQPTAVAAIPHNGTGGGIQK